MIGPPPVAVSRPPTPVAIEPVKVPDPEPIKTPDPLPMPSVRSPEPAFLSGKNGAEPVARTPISTLPKATPLDPPAMEKSGGKTGLIVSGIVVVLGVAAALYLFVFKKKANGDSPGGNATNSAAIKPANVLAAGAKPDAGPAVKMAQVKVTSTPAGATVQVDGQPMGGPTPTTLSLPADKPVKLTISIPCYSEDSEQITPSAKPAVDATLKALDKVVHVTSDPKGANVLVDGKAQGAAPVDVKLTGRLDPTKPHIFTLQLRGYDDATQTVNADSTCVTEGTTGGIALAQTLTPKQSAVVINNPPPHIPHNPPPNPVVSSAAMTTSEAPPIPVASSAPEAAPASSAPAATPASSAPKEPVTTEAPKSGCGGGPACQPGEKCEDGACCDPSADAPDFIKCKQ
jgi:hypothetical protein